MKKLLASNALDVSDITSVLFEFTFGARELGEEGLVTDKDVGNMFAWAAANAIRSLLQIF